MGNEKYKNLKIESSKIMNSLFVGNFKASFAGKGIEFQDFREYSPGDDAKYIDWVRSSQEGTTIMRRYREDKDADILCFIDNNLGLELQQARKRKLLQELLSLLYQASSASGEKFGGFVYQDTDYEYINPSKSPVGFHGLIDATDRVNQRSKKCSLDALMSPNLKKSVVFIISDSMDIDSPSYSAAGLKHDIIFIHLSTYFEDTLEGEGIRSLRNRTQTLSIDLSDSEKKEEYKKLRIEKKKVFSSKLKSQGIDSMFIHEKTSLIESFLTLMKQRNI